jgi:hypothetical protein
MLHSINTYICLRKNSGQQTGTGSSNTIWEHITESQGHLDLPNLNLHLNETPVIHTHTEIGEVLLCSSGFQPLHR